MCVSDLLNQKKAVLNRSNYLQVMLRCGEETSHVRMAFAPDECAHHNIQMRWPSWLLIVRTNFVGGFSRLKESTRRSHDQGLGAFPQPSVAALCLAFICASMVTCHDMIDKHLTIFLSFLLFLEAAEKITSVVLGLLIYKSTYCEHSDLEWISRVHFSWRLSSCSKLRILSSIRRTCNLLIHTWLVGLTLLFWRRRIHWVSGLFRLPMEPSYSCLRFSKRLNIGSWMDIADLDLSLS